MNTKFGTESSTCANTHDGVAGGRKTKLAVAGTGTTEDAAVLVSLGRDDAVVFSDDVESVPSLDTEEESDDEEEEEEEEYDEEDAELDEGLAERLRILADAKALKKLAVAFLHPEEPVQADPACFGRNYFDRPSAPQQMEDEDADEEAEILADALQLKAAARAYLHPEDKVEATDATVFGRNYFDRFSAPEVEDFEEAQERARILAEAKVLKHAAVDYMHPEVGVTATYGAAFGRNYFNRPSAPETEEDEFADERAEILADAAALKEAAAAYMHPEVGVKSTDGACFGRNYFNRPSAPETEDMEEAQERARVLAEAAALKKQAVAYMHPEVGVTATDGACFGRNYFNRPSAPETEEDEFADERAEILADAAALKKSAVDYMHPEVGVKSTDGACFGRNYFTRPSAPDLSDGEDEVPYVEVPDARVWLANERAQVLKEAAALKKSAVDYMHPEIGVTTTDATAFGRNYFNRFSAPETEEDEYADERAEILEEAAALKKLAADYMHPEVGVTKTDGACFGRNYFNRYSATQTEDVEEAEERARVLAEAAALKQSAMDYMHPEIGVTTTDPTLFGRNYFNRPSAPETEEDEFADERAEVLAEAAALKKLATDYMHPEVGVTATDATVFGRNYFDRPSALETEDFADADERARVLADALALKKSAADYLHPEVGVTTTDATAFGRNYFSRYSAPEMEEDEFADERARVLAEAAALKKSAVDYMHPEVGVTSTDGACFGRNYFNRPSAPQTEDEDAEERARILAETAALKKSAVDYMHPEVGVTATDPTVFGRNYFNRFSAPVAEVPKKVQKTEGPAESQEVAAVKNLAAAVKGANLPSTKTITKLSSADIDAGATKKSASSVNLFGLSEEVV